MDGDGTYTLVVGLADDACIAFGAAGERRLPAGAYAYVGTAFGPGGFARVDRHRELARGERDARHWHVDYLLGHPASTVESVVTSDGIDAECAVATRLADEVTAVEHLGASDCGCDTHLFGPEPVEQLAETVTAAHEAARRAH
ncbi:DUF123 domain-containing protein [Halomarina salina]|uniref:DUF123 domain-containing protein n=1 Tax=Halomarina salina TaxID=1872699 RepID=A0ABD5RP39_9EURY|nr:GIY-YIG nuclease family protein [Halomarina salina]